MFLLDNPLVARLHAQMPRSVTWRWRFAIAAASVLLGGCGEGNPSRSQLLSQGRRVFVDAGCGRCHAVATVHAHGGVGPDFDSSERLNRDQIRIEVDYGANGMPSYHSRLTDRQREAVVEFVYQTLHRSR